MISNEDKKRMKNFIEDRIEDSDSYNIIESKVEHIIIAQKPELVKNPSKVYIKLHNNKRKTRKYPNLKMVECLANLNLVDTNTKQGMFTANIFYKDEENYFLKQEEGIKLSDIEKLVLRHQMGDNSLVYYQPNSIKRNESLRFYRIDIGMDNVAENIYEIDKIKIYEIAKETARLRKGGIEFKQVPNSWILMPKIMKKEKNLKKKSLF